MGKDILFICDRCNALVEGNRTRYVLVLKLFAGTDPIDLDDAERPADFDYNREIHRLIEAMRDMDEVYLHDQVHMERKYYLCAACREALYREVFMDSRRTPDPEKEGRQGV
ncbi:hypothetical protein HS125_05470 [bacterium]|nr:hypothetical protein [bacterium]